MKTVNWMLMLLLVLLVGCSCPGCWGEDAGADAEVAEQLASRMKDAIAQAGLPDIVNYKELKDAKLIYELRDKEDMVCYAYLHNKMNGRLVFIGRCLGYGLPYCVQYANPERVVDYEEQHHTNWSGKGRLGLLPQPEPNGLFMPQTLAATWLMMIDPKTGNPRPVYIEPEIVVSPFPLDLAVGK